MDTNKSTQDRWEEASHNAIIQSLEKGRPIHDLVTPEQIGEAREKSTAVICSDERIAPGDKGKIGIAGSLILASASDIDSFVAQNRGAIEEVTSHDGCGAAQLKFNELKEAGQLPEGVTSSSDLAQKFSQELAARLGVEYRHISASTKTGDLHDARAIWVDGTGNFRPDKVPGMPSHFLSSGAGLGLDEKYVAHEVSVLSSIALGDHGFGERFDVDHPLQILVAAANEKQRGALEESLRETLAPYGDRIRQSSMVIGE